MKIAIISDIHFGVNYGKGDFADYQKWYFKEFWKEVDDRGCRYVFFLGDFFHNRRMVNFDTVQLAVDCWFKPAMERGVEIYMLVGNHDVFYKSTNDLNSLDLLCWNKNIKVISEAMTINVEGHNYCFLPWLNVQNKEKSLKELDSTRASVVLSHLELQLDNPHITGQIELEKLERFHTVFSGHFHTPALKEITGCRLQYLGSPYEMTWNDYGIKERGFYVFDDETKEYELIRNTRPIHFYHKLGEDVSHLKPWHSIRCTVPKGMSSLEYEIAMTALKKVQVMRVQMLEESGVEEVTEGIEIVEGELDILNVLLKYAENNVGDLNMKRMKGIVEGLWEEVKG